MPYPPFNFAAAARALAYRNRIARIRDKAAVTLATLPVALHGTDHERDLERIVRNATAELAGE